MQTTMQADWIVLNISIQCRLLIMMEFEFDCLLGLSRWMESSILVTQNQNCLSCLFTKKRFEFPLNSSVELPLDTFSLFRE